MTTEIVTQHETLKAEIAPVKAHAMALIIAEQSHVEAARDIIREIKERRDRVDETFDKHIKAAHQAHKDLVATKRTFTDDLDAAEKIIKGKVGAFQLLCEKIAREIQEKARITAETERKRVIEAARKKIEATLDKAGTLGEKVTALELSLKDDYLGEVERGLIERQLEVLRLQLQGLEDKAAEAQRKAEEVAEAPAYIPPAAVVEKTAGVATKKTYIVTVLEPLQLIQAIAGGQGSAGLVKEWDMVTLRKLALLGIFMSGCSYQEDRQVNIR